MTTLHPIHRVRTFEIVSPYVLKVQFDDGEIRTIDFRPVLEGELYGPLRDLNLFNRVHVDTDAHTLVWPNGADFDPTTLHEWPEVSPQMAAMARQWAQTSKARAG